MPRDKEIKIPEKQTVYCELCLKDQNITEINCRCQPLPKWVKWLTIVLIVAIFVMACVQIHYLWKLSDIWQAVKGSK